MVLIQAVSHTRRVINWHTVNDIDYKVCLDGVYLNDKRIYAADEPISGSCSVKNTIALKLVSGVVLVLQSLTDKPSVFVTNKIITAYSNDFRHLATTEGGNYIVTTNCIRSNSLISVADTNAARLATIYPRCATEDVELQIAEVDGKLVVWELYGDLIVYIYSPDNASPIDKVIFSSRSYDSVAGSSSHKGPQLVAYNNKCLWSFKKGLHKVTYMGLQETKSNIPINDIVFESGFLGVSSCAVNGKHIPFVFKDDGLFRYDNDELEKVDFEHVDPSYKSTSDYFSETRYPLIRYKGGKFQLFPFFFYDGCVLDGISVDGVNSIALGHNNLSLLKRFKPLKLVSSPSVGIKISSVFYESALDLLLLTTINNTTLLVGDNIKLPKEIQGRAVSCVSQENEVQIVFSDRVENYQLDGTLTNTVPLDIVLNAIIIKGLGVVLQYHDRVEVLNGDVLLKDAMISSIRYDENKQELYICYSQPLQKVDYDKYFSLPREKFEAGYVTVIKSTSRDTYKFDATPTAFHKFGNDNAVVFFENNTTVYGIGLSLEEPLLCEHSLKSPVRIGYGNENYAVLYGMGLYLISSDLGIYSLGDPAHQDASLISGMAPLQDGKAFACVSNGQLQVFDCENITSFAKETVSKEVKLKVYDNTSTKMGRYRLLDIPSLNAIAVYRKTFCTFYDRDTLDVLIVDGLHLTFFSSMTLCSNNVVAITAEAGELETFELNRNGNTIGFSKKYAVSIYKNPFTSIETASANGKIMTRMMDNSGPETISELHVIDSASGEAIADVSQKVDCFTGVHDLFIIASGCEFKVFDKTLKKLTELNISEDRRIIDDNPLRTVTMAAGAYFGGDSFMDENGEQQPAIIIAATLVEAQDADTDTRVPGIETDTRAPRNVRMGSHLVLLGYDIKKKKLSLKDIDANVKTFWDLPRTIKFSPRSNADKVEFDFINFREELATLTYP